MTRRWRSDQVTSGKFWWSRMPPGSRPNVIFLQVDVGGHLKQVREAPTDMGPFESFRIFGMELTRILRRFGFHRLHWLGDGGLFAKQLPHGTAESLCGAADAAFGLFRKTWPRSRTRMTFRMSGTFIADVLISPDPGEWFSVDLNVFLKYERNIAEQNAFAITEALRSKLVDPGPEFKRFAHRKAARRVLLPTGDTVVMYRDSRHMPCIVKDPSSFGVWLKKIFPKKFVASDDTDGIGIGDSVIFHTAFGPEGYEADSVEMIPSEAVWSDPTIQEICKGGDKSLKGQKASVKQLSLPQTDDPVLRVYWQPVEFWRLRAFQLFVQDPANRRDWEKLRPEATNHSDRRLPNGLAVHGSVYVTGPNGQKYLILAHRAEKRPGRLYENCWSASFEENFSGVESQRDGRTYPRDMNLHETVIRGMREEFLGEGWSKPMNVRLHAGSCQQE